MSLSTIEIAGRPVGEAQPCYIIAEAGVNHNGDPALAKKLIDIAADAGADAVKFQKRTVSDILIAAALERPYTVPTSLGATYGEHREKLELSAEVYADLIAHAKTRGITLLASAWDPNSVDFLEALGIPAYKIASADCSNLPLIEYVAKTGKPVLLSTGMSDLAEVDEAVATVRRHNDQLVLFQCTSTYPADNDQLNLRVILTYKARYGCVVGYSGHERGLAPTEAAVAIGANVVERHFTIDRTMIGPDHAASLEPDGLKRLVRNIRNIEKALGSSEKRLLDAEKPVRDRLAKSVVAKQTIPAGTMITADMLTVKGPGSGLRPNTLPYLVGVVAESEIPGDTLVPNEAIKWRRG
ncbi:MAG: N-acetylneuraminate synthase family protein [Chloroflexi bacterium]|nr:N-acetylneuraminate synthase family protein [Chloroflexota bacterium]